jgi:hypothetical protein
MRVRGWARDVAALPLPGDAALTGTAMLFWPTRAGLHELRRAAHRRVRRRRRAPARRARGDRAGAPGRLSCGTSGEAARQRYRSKRKT